MGLDDDLAGYDISTDLEPLHEGDPWPWHEMRLDCMDDTYVHHSSEDADAASLIAAAEESGYDVAAYRTPDLRRLEQRYGAAAMADALDIAYDPGLPGGTTVYRSAVRTRDEREDDIDQEPVLVHVTA